MSETLTVLRPGARVLCVFSDDRDINVAKRCMEQLRERFPDIEFIALSGADRVLVQPSEGTP